MSLQQEALRYHRENPSKHAELDRLLQKRRCQDLDQEVYNSLKDNTKALYREFLQGFSGVVCCTPTVASNHEFWLHFRPFQEQGLLEACPRDSAQVGLGIGRGSQVAPRRHQDWRARSYAARWVFAPSLFL
ncbi:hypothetical protein IMZ48_31205 [Candidatus Bathyarchaeota archaeon]|nr:hypothetical protein [Candidatus Bathyarchaeota archaeon]